MRPWSQQTLSQNSLKNKIINLDLWSCLYHRRQMYALPTYNENSIWRTIHFIVVVGSPFVVICMRVPVVDNYFILFDNMQFVADPLYGRYLTKTDCHVTFECFLCTWFVGRRLFSNRRKGCIVLQPDVGWFGIHCYYGGNRPCFLSAGFKTLCYFYGRGLNLWPVLYFKLPFNFILRCTILPLKRHLPKTIINQSRPFLADIG